MSSTEAKQVKVIKKYRITGDIDRSKRTAAVGTKIDYANILPETATRKRKDYTYSEPTKAKHEMLPRPQSRASSNVFEKRAKTIVPIISNKENTTQSNVETVTDEMSKLKIRKRKTVEAVTKPATTQAVLSDAVLEQVKRLNGTVKVLEPRSYSTRTKSMPVHIQAFVDIAWPANVVFASKPLKETFELLEFALQEDELNFDFAQQFADFVLIGESNSFLLIARESQSNPDFIVNIVNPEENKTVASIKLSEFLSGLKLQDKPADD